MNFREWRRRMGWTQDQASKGLGYDIRNIKRYDAGQLLPPLVMELAMQRLEMAADDTQEKAA